MARALRLLLTVILLAAPPAIGLAACGSGPASPDAQGIDANTPNTNDLIPEDQNLSDCIGTLQRPDCGSSRKADVNMYIAFGVLMLGMSFIGWRIVVGVRRRDRNVPPPTSTF